MLLRIPIPQVRWLSGVSMKQGHRVLYICTYVCAVTVVSLGIYVCISSHCVHWYSMTPNSVCVCVFVCRRVSPSACQRHSPSLSPRLTVTGRDPSNYLFLDHMQMAEQCGERRLAGAAAGLMSLATGHSHVMYQQSKCSTLHSFTQDNTHE